jgi:hypothetical protein
MFLRAYALAEMLVRHFLWPHAQAIERESVAGFQRVFDGKPKLGAFSREVGMAVACDLAAHKESVVGYGRNRDRFRLAHPNCPTISTAAELRSEKWRNVRNRCAHAFGLIDPDTLTSFVGCIDESGTLVEQGIVGDLAREVFAAEGHSELFDSVVNNYAIHRPMEWEEFTLTARPGSAGESKPQ